MPLDVTKAERRDFDELRDKHIGVFHDDLTHTDNPHAETIDQTIDRMLNAGGCQIWRMAPGENITLQGQPFELVPVYVLLPGSLFAVKHSYRQSAVGKRRGGRRHTAEPGDLDDQMRTLTVALDSFGVVCDVEYFIRDVEKALLARGATDTCKATVTAMTESRVMAVGGPARDIMMKSPRIQANLLRLLSLKILRRSARGDALEVYDRATALTFVLTRLAQDRELGGIGTQTRAEVEVLPRNTWPRTIGEDYRRLRVRVLQKDWAMALAVSLLSVHNDFAHLQKKEIAVYSDGFIFINPTVINRTHPIFDGIEPIFW